MKPAAFEYYRPRTLDEALSLLAEHGEDAKPLAGGQSLIPAMNFRLATPAVLVDLNELAELSYVRKGSGTIRIGSMTRQSLIERDPLIAATAALVTDAMPYVAHRAIRNRGTVGGSLAHADPAAELPAVMMALDARLTVSGTAESREVPAADFFTGLFTTAIQPGELLTEIAIPPQAPNSGHAFEEISRRHGDFALVGVAAVVQLDGGGLCTGARIALLSVGDRAMLATHAAEVLIGHQPSAELIRAAAETTSTEDIDPSTDIHASARYRRQLASVLTRRVLNRAFARARSR